MQKFIRRLKKAKNCPLCANKKRVVDYKDTEILNKYISERGKILSRAKTGICAKHQRQVTKSIKIARTMALLPFTRS